MPVDPMMRSFLPLTALALLALAVGAGADADPDSGDYVFIDTPAVGTVISSDEIIEGRAGNDLLVPFIGVESSPQAEDEHGDNTYGHDLVPEDERDELPDNTTGTDIGNLYVSYDDGATINVALRLYEQYHAGTESAQVEYQAMFTHVPTDARYRLTAYADATEGWQVGLMARAAGTASVWCGADDDSSDGLDDFNSAGMSVGWTEFVGGAGGLITWTLPYEKINLTGTPSTNCVSTTGPPAVVGDVLTDWHAESVQRSRSPGVLGLPSSSVMTQGGWTGDMSQGPTYSDHVLGAGVRFPPSPPFAPASITVNGLDGGLVTPDAVTDEWIYQLRTSKYTPLPDCTYVVEAFWGTAAERHVYLAEGCTPEGAKRFGLDLLRRTEQVGDQASARTMQAAPSPSGSDSDLDGVSDDEDACPYMHNDYGGLVCGSDLDGDGVHNGIDNCPADVNPEQADTDGDGIGDACIHDADGDGVADGRDNCRDTPNTAQADLDGDGFGDACDDDMDGDGVANGQDGEKGLHAMDARRGMDADGDGIEDLFDRDPEGDGEAVDAGAHIIAQDASIGALGSLGLLSVLVLVGVGLFFMLRPRS